MRGFILAGVLAAMTACTPSDLVTAYKLRNVDPFTTDASALRVAVEIPGAFQPQSDRVALTVKVTRADGTDTSQMFALVAAPDGPDERVLRASIENDRTLYVYRIAPDSVAAFEAVRQTIRLAREAEGHSSGELSVDTPICSNVIALPDDVPVSVYLKLAELRDYVTLVDNEDMLQDSDATDVQAVLPRCD